MPHEGCKTNRRNTAQSAQKKNPPGNRTRRCPVPGGNFYAHRAKIFPGDDNRSDGIISGKRKPEGRPLREVRPPCPGSVGGRRR